LINGKIKKVDIDDLRKIADTLDMSLQEILKVAGYDEFLLSISKDKYAGKSNKDLKELLEQYKASETDFKDKVINKEINKHLYVYDYCYAILNK
jgi:hypothetical protein